MIMAKIISCLLSFVIIAAVPGQNQQLRFSKHPQDYIKKVACSTQFDAERESLKEQSKCGEPKEVFKYFINTRAYEQLSPRAVWIKRCVGVCDYDNGGTCNATEIAIRFIPIRIYNAKTNKETCATYPIIEHLSCKCCDKTPAECPAPRIVYPPIPGC